MSLFSDENTNNTLSNFGDDNNEDSSNKKHVFTRLGRLITTSSAEVDTAINSPVDTFVDKNSFENWDLEGKSKMTEASRVLLKPLNRVSPISFEAGYEDNHDQDSRLLKSGQKEITIQKIQYLGTWGLRNLSGKAPLKDRNIVQKQVIQNWVFKDIFENDRNFRLRLQSITRESIKEKIRNIQEEMKEKGE